MLMKQMDNSLPSQVLVSPPQEDIKSPPPTNFGQVPRIKPYLPLLVITLSLPIIFISSRPQSTFVGQAKSTCGNSYPCPTKPPCPNSTNCPPSKPTPAPTANKTPKITTNSLVVGRVGRRYLAPVMGIDGDTQEKLDLKVSNLPKGLITGKCYTYPDGKTTKIACTIQGAASEPGVFTVTLTLQDRPDRPDSIKVSKNLTLRVMDK